MLKMSCIMYMYEVCFSANIQVHVWTRFWWSLPILSYFIFIPPENNSEESKKKKKSEDEGKSAASNGETTQLTTSSPTERGKGKLEKKKKGRDKSEKSEGRVIYDRVRDRCNEYV